MATDINPRAMVVNFAADNHGIPALQFIREDPDGVSIEHITDSGIVNHIFRVQSADKTSSVIIKYAEETFRMLPTEKLPIGRQELEYNCLCLMQEVEPGSAPQPFCLETKHNLLAMADLSDWELLACQLERGLVDLKAATHLGQVLGKLCRQTLRNNVTEEQWKDYQKKIHHAEIKEFSRSLNFDRRFNETDPINVIPESALESYRTYIKEIRAAGIDKKLNDLFNMETCLVHGDCHYKAIFSKDGRVSLFDFELSFIGNPNGYLGHVIMSYILSFLLNERHGSDVHTATGLSAQQFKTVYLQAIRNIVVAYMEVQKDIANNEARLMTFLSEVTLFTGSYAFQISTYTSVENLIKVFDDEDRRRMMEAGFTLMKTHADVKSLDQFTEAMSLRF